MRGVSCERGKYPVDSTEREGTLVGSHQSPTGHPHGAISKCSDSFLLSGATASVMRCGTFDASQLSSNSSTVSAVYGVNCHTSMVPLNTSRRNQPDLARAAHQKFLLAFHRAQVPDKVDMLAVVALELELPQCQSIVLRFGLLRDKARDTRCESYGACKTGSKEP